MLSHEIPDTAFSWFWPEVVWSLDHVPGIWKIARTGRIRYRVTEQGGPITWKSLPAWNGLQIPAFPVVFRMPGSWPVCGQSPKQQKGVPGSRGIPTPCPRATITENDDLLAFHQALPWLTAFNKQKYQASMCLHLETQKAFVLFF